MSEVDPNEVAQNISSYDDIKLIKASTLNRSDYTDEAQRIIDAEISKRHIDPVLITKITNESKHDNRYVPKLKSNQKRVYASIVGTLLFFYAGYALIDSCFIYIGKEYYSDAVIMVIPLIPMIFGWYIISTAMIENWITASTVEFNEDGILGYPRYGKKTFFIKYNEILKIRPPTGYKPYFVAAALVLENNEGEYFCISVDINGFADCADLLKEKAINAVQIDFGTWPKNRRVWTKRKVENPYDWWNS